MRIIMKTSIRKSMVTVFILDLTRLAKVQTTSVRKLSRNCFEILTVAQYDSFFQTFKVDWKNCRPWFVPKRDRTSNPATNRDLQADNCH